MKKLLISVIAVTSLSAFADVNSNAQSYGKWRGYSEGVVSISKNGVDGYANSSVTCDGKKYKYLQKMASYSGSQLVGRINEAIEYGDDSPQLKAIKKVISPKGKYSAIDVYPPKCADGGVTFVQLNANIGLYIESAPDDVFYILKKN